MRLITALFLLPLLWLSAPLWAAEGDPQPVPALQAPVTDLAQLLSQADTTALNDKLMAFSRQKGSQMAVLIVPTTAPETIFDYSFRVADSWKLGRKGVDDGVLLVVAVKDRKTHLQVGYGLEGAIPDARAKQIIENFMIGANGVTARYLAEHGFPSIRRVVRVPKRWDRLVDVAAEYGHSLPAEPDSGALEDFLVERKSADPLRFPDLSLTVVKLLGSGEYVADLPEDQPIGHFGLAVRDYAHSTAPNRRYPDLLTQRLLKAALAHARVPYSKDRLDELAQHCTEAEDAATKVERRVQKSAAALLLEDRIGEQFDGIVTGAAEKGTWVRLLDIPVEGKLVHGFKGVDVGDRVRVQLLETDVERGFIDFGLVSAAPLSKPGALKS